MSEINGETIPFGDLFAVDRKQARSRLERELGAEAHTVSAEAWHDLETALTARLSSLAVQALYQDFDGFRGGPPAGIAVRLAEAGIRRERHKYRAFIEQTRDGWTGRWPVLARLLASVTGLWVRNCAEMIRRLRDEGCGPVLRIEPDLSDPHDGGRTVHVLTFEGGRRRVYKPRGLGLEAAFVDFLGWCNERGLSLELRGASAIDRGSYGWMDFVAPEPCAGEAGVRRFHRRAGMLLGILHAFGSRDFHYENLVACGEHPILIDLEAWLPVRLRKWLPGQGLGEAWYEAARRIEGSVLSTGLLPAWQEGRRRGELRNVGGLGGGQPGARLEEVWLNVNSDAMVRIRREVEIPAQPNVPGLGGRPVEPWEYREEVVAGFSEMVALLLRHRDSLPGLLRRLASERARLVFRSTAAYKRLLARSLNPACCRGSAARARVLAALDEVFPATKDGLPARPLLAAERQALEGADVPLFRVPVDGTRIELPGGGSVEGALETTSLEVVRERWESLGEEDLRLQTAFIRAALAPRLAAGDPGIPGSRLDRGRFLEAAAALAARLHDCAVLGKDGSAAWIGPRHLTAGDLYELTVLGPDLYGGTAGIALFLAAFSRVSGDARSRDLALRAIAPLRDRAWQQRTSLGIGGLAGISSILYAFVWIGELLGEDALIAEALGLSALLTPQRIAADRDLDVVSGSAGAILALLALDRAAPGALEIANACADHLLARQSPSQEGFAHGAAGIGYALLRLHARTGRQDLREEALERLRFRPRANAPATWCRGAPGVALARLGTLDVLDTSEIREEIRTALESTRSAPLSAMDHLCCGNLGRAEILLDASRILGDPELLEEARDLATRVLLRAERFGGFGCTPFGCAPFGGSALTDPSLFRGEAGIGFACLRLAGRHELPCLLRLEAPAACYNLNIPLEGME